MLWCLAKRAKWPAVALVAVASTAPAFAQPPAGQRTAAALMAVEHQWLGALNRHDVTILARILAREYIDSDFQGDAIARAQYLAYFAKPVLHPAPPVEQRFEDTKVRFVAGGDVAIVTGIVTTQPAAISSAATSSNANNVRHSRFTDVFVYRDGRWQAVTGQETHFTRATG